ncbi:MAG: dienelactone hydrolase family protein [Nitrososphaeraceae archaeon]|nr:dienelactone hydrolase family protein [Nitrososphaeraceae archaeon]
MAERRPKEGVRGGEKVEHTIVRIPLAPVAGNEKEPTATLEGNLTLPYNNRNTTKGGIVIFAHGSGSSRHSPRNQFVSQALNNDGLATLLVDLLTPEEEETDIRTQKIQCKVPGLVLNKFNIKLLSRRLTAIIDWVISSSLTITTPTIKNAENHNNFNIGIFGSSTGAAAALIAAAQRPDIVAAIVSRSGRPDLANLQSQQKVKAPTLFIVGGNDDKRVIDLNNKALRQLVSAQKKKIITVPGATHLFEEPGALEEVARLASGWFRCYFLIKEHNNNGSALKSSSNNYNNNSKMK